MKIVNAALLLFIVDVIAGSVLAHLLSVILQRTLYEIFVLMQ